MAKINQDALFAGLATEANDPEGGVPELTEVLAKALSGRDGLDEAAAKVVEWLKADPSRKSRLKKVAPGPLCEKSAAREVLLLMFEQAGTPRGEVLASRPAAAVFTSPQVPARTGKLEQQAIDQLGVRTPAFEAPVPRQ